MHRCDNYVIFAYPLEVLVIINRLYFIDLKIINYKFKLTNKLTNLTNKLTNPTQCQGSILPALFALDIVVNTHLPTCQYTLITHLTFRT